MQCLLNHWRYRKEKIESYKIKKLIIGIDSNRGTVKIEFSPDASKKYIDPTQTIESFLEKTKEGQEQIKLVNDGEMYICEITTIRAVQNDRTITRKYRENYYFSLCLDQTLLRIIRCGTETD
jgi:hypothetical protein